MYNMLTIKTLLYVSVCAALFSKTGSGISEANFDHGPGGAEDPAFSLQSLESNSTTTPMATTQQTIFNVTATMATVTQASNVTNTSNQLALGFISAGVAVVFFGSNFVPVKKFESGDGMFFQWVVVSAIWIVGLIVNMIRHVPTFHPLAMLGGFLWATGNITVVPIIKTIGLGLGLCIWGSFNLLIGWTSGRFGWFGLTPQEPNNKLLNYLGVGFAVCSVFIYLMVQSEVSQQQPGGDVDRRPLLDSDNIQVNVRQEQPQENSDASWVDKLSPMWKRIIGCLMSVVAGCLYGLNFTPCIWIQDNVEGASNNGLDYVFAHFCGIYATGTAYFIIYCILMKNKPKIYPRLILPAMLSGGMWGIAQSAWFIANFTLEEAVSFPIITTGPGIIAALWGVVVFKEIKGRRNLIVLLIAFAVTVTGAVLTGLSKLDNL